MINVPHPFVLRAPCGSMPSELRPTDKAPHAVGGGHVDMLTAVLVRVGVHTLIRSVAPLRVSTAEDGSRFDVEVPTLNTLFTSQK